MKIEEKILFWKKEAARALAVAEDLFKVKRYIESLFFGHLALEKLLKAKIISITQKEPLYSHDLVILAKHAKIILDNEDLDFLVRVNIYNIRVRYQDYKMSLYKQASKAFVNGELIKIKKFFYRIK